MARNYYRLCDALAHFHHRYGRWPTRVRLPDACLRALQNGDVAPGGFERLAALFSFSVDESAFAVEDHTEAMFDYMHYRFGDGQTPAPGIEVTITEVRAWLRVEPNGWD